VTQRDPWSVLDVAPADGVPAAKLAWRELVALYHPDHHVDMPPGVQARAAAGLIAVNNAWYEIRDAATGAPPASEEAAPSPADDRVVGDDMVIGNGLWVPVDEFSTTFWVEGAPFDAKRIIKAATKQAGFVIRQGTDGGLLASKGSFSSGQAVAIAMAGESDDRTRAEAASPSTSMLVAFFAALRGAATR